MDHSFLTYAKFSEKLTFFTCAYQGVRNVSFSENFACLLNERSLIRVLLILGCNRTAAIFLWVFGAGINDGIQSFLIIRVDIMGEIFFTQQGFKLLFNDF